MAKAELTEPDTAETTTDAPEEAPTIFFRGTSVLMRSAFRHRHGHFELWEVPARKLGSAIARGTLFVRQGEGLDHELTEAVTEGRTDALALPDGVVEAERDNHAVEQAIRGAVTDPEPYLLRLFSNTRLFANN